MLTQIQQTNRLNFISVLRQETLPNRFRWYFPWIYKKDRMCGAAGCAIGLAYEIGLIREKSIDQLASALGLSLRTAAKIFVPVFFVCWWRYGCGYRKVTASMVADAIERVPA